MLKIGIAGCGLQAATIASYLSMFGDACEAVAVMDIDEAGAKARLAEKKVTLSENCRFSPDPDSFVSSLPPVDGIIIGTYCADHADAACRLEKLHVPLWLEKPAALDFPQLRRLVQTFRDSPTPVQVSLPMRVSPLAVRAKEIIDSGRLGKVRQIVGFEDTDGLVYFSTWFRDAEKTGGMFMQKAVHDIDYLLYLSGMEPESVCAMREKVWHVGEKDYEQTCEKCSDKLTCSFGPMSYFERRGKYASLAEAEKYLSGVYTADGKFLRKRFCSVAGGIAIEDLGECIVRGKNGIHLIHTQNFIASGASARRGARLIGDRGALEIDFTHGRLSFFSSWNGETEICTIPSGQFSHYGGDKVLTKEFLNTMKTGKRGATDLITGSGFMSTLTCLCARESADTGQFVDIKRMCPA